MPASQGWFWSDEWQQREREVDAEITRREVTSYQDMDAFPGHLDVLDAELAEERRPSV